MNCQFIRDNLIDIVEERFPAETRKEIDAHLNSCKKCAVLTDRFAQLWQTWQDPVSVDPSPAFSLQLWQRIQKSEEKGLPVPFLLSGWQRRLRTTAAVAAMVVSVLAGNYLGRVPAGDAVDSSRQLTSQETQESTIPAERLFDYYFGGLEDFPSGSVGEFYVNPGQNG
jgi:predicted anti-sigma-YlaC factor YlaD